MLEKAKQTLEAENADLATELKSASAARADGERRRKQAEAQLVELAAKLQEIERAKLVYQFLDDPIRRMTGLENA